LISIMCCNLTQPCEKFQIVPRKKTKNIFKERKQFFLREIICYLKKCKNCNGSRITVFAECMDGEIYFIESIKSKNVRDFLLKNKLIRRLKNLGRSVISSKSIPLNYFDRGKEIPCNVNFSGIKIAPYDTDVLADLKKRKYGNFIRQD